MIERMRKSSITIVGLGYVGLTVALLASKKGYKVFGIDIDKNKVKIINDGRSPIEEDYIVENMKYKIHATTDFSVIDKSEIIIVCIPTPIKKDNTPDLKPLKSTLDSIAKNINNGQLVVIESTVAPGTCRRIVKPILEKSEFKIGKNIHLAHCPERIDPGNKKWTIENIPRVIGALSDEGRERSAIFYESIINSPIKRLSSIEAAEATKIVENTFRDINIAFVNELAKSFDKLQIDVLEVIESAATKPFAFIPHYPGCGVGGHCISVDPYYLIEKAKDSGFEHKFLELARSINRSMPEYTVQRTIEGLNEIGICIKDTEISILGISYKPNIDDIRESPSFEIVSRLKDMGAKLKVYDPYIKKMSTVDSLNSALNSKCIIIVTAHDEFREIDIKKLKKNGVEVIIDGRNCLNKDKIINSGIVYKGIGR